MKQERNRTIPGQISIFDYLEERAKTVTVSFATAKERVIASLEEYLQKGEYLTSLAKERFERIMRGYTLSEIEEKIFSLPSPETDYCGCMKALAKSVVRPLLRSIKDFDDSDKNYMLLKSLVDVEIELFRPELKGPKRVGAVWQLTFKDKKTTDIVGLTIREPGWKDKTLYGYKGLAHARVTYNRYFTRDYSIVCDVSEVLSFLILKKLFKRAMDDEALRPVIKERWDERKYQFYNLPYTPQEKRNQGYTYVRSDDLEPYFWHLKENAYAPFVVHPLRYKRPSEDALTYFCHLTGIEHDDIWVLDVPVKEMERRNNMAEVDSGYRTTWRHFLPKEHLEVALLWATKFDAWDKGVGHFAYNDLVSYSEGREELNDPTYVPPSWGIPTLPAIYSDLWIWALGALWQKSGQTVKTVRYLRELQKSSRATVWMTKKNIPKKITDEMQKSAFNDYFGYVEFDETVDVKKAKIIADEFIAFRETYLRSFDTSRVSLRFRRLGNHKATGLYFPNINCLCVDVGSPSSFVHEFGHCIDYLCGGDSALSDQGTFYPVYSRYRRMLLDFLAKKDNEDIKRRLKGKYNLQYYLLNSEVFARCFEIYCTRVLEIKNSICKPEERMYFAYPEDDKLLKLITDYFDVLCGSLNKGEAIAEEESYEAELAA